MPSVGVSFPSFKTFYRACEPEMKHVITILKEQDPQAIIIHNLMMNNDLKTFPTKDKTMMTLVNLVLKVVNEYNIVDTLGKTYMDNMEEAEKKVKQGMMQEQEYKTLCDRAMRQINTLKALKGVDVTKPTGKTHFIKHKNQDVIILEFY